MGGHISERADKFAKKLVKPEKPVDDRSVELKMAEFRIKYSARDLMKDTRRKVKSV